MKAERRHELKTNALARGVEGAPDLWREYGSRILLIVLVAAIVFLLVRYWNDKKLRDAQMVTESLQTANSSVHELSLLPLEIRAGGSAADVAQNRLRVVQQAEQSINTVLNSSKDPKVLADAYLARGDLNWTLANFPELPGAQTLPSNLQLTNRDIFTEQARSSYEKVLDPQYSGSSTDVFYARMGLAAVAENLGQWDQAKLQYEAIRDAANMPDSFKEVASTRLTDLAKAQTPVLLVPPPVAATTPAQAASEPSTQEAPGLMPTTSIWVTATAPSTRPALAPKSELRATPPSTQPTPAPSSHPATTP